MAEYFDTANKVFDNFETDNNKKEPPATKETDSPKVRRVYT